jgi:predicted ATPase/DNA-binding SARP family transcriptional activator
VTDQQGNAKEPTESLFRRFGKGISVTVIEPDDAAAHAENAPSLILHLFGPMEVRVRGALLPRVRVRRGHWLLALLALRAGREVDRAWLASTLWPDTPGPQAFASLRSSLKHLREVLGPDADRLRAPSPQTLALDLTDADADVVVFDAAIAQGDVLSLERAVAIYRGPLLEGCAGEWAFQERQAREHAYLTALERLAAAALGCEDADTAESYLRQAVAADPLRESAQRALMQTLAASGKHAAAFRVYQELCRLLHCELNATPDPETTALFQALRSGARPATPGAAIEEGIVAPLGPRAALSRGDEARAATRARRHQLPLPPTPLIGREQELAVVRQLLLRDDVRLLTLAGPPGTGKTRLGLQVGADLHASFADGACFVSLAPLRDPGLVVPTIANALGVRESGDRPLLESLKDLLCAKQLLLVLDNFEHLLDAASQIAELAAAASRLKVLVTSRAVLRVRGEQEFPVPPLSLPDPERLPPLPALSKYAAVELFIQRAVGVKPDFRVTEENAAAVAELCCRLDGLPLAIELAAARMKLFSPEGLLGQLGNRLKLLTGGPRDLPARQQTLRDAIAWSYDLLVPEEQRLFRRLSVFVGGCTLKAVAAVHDPEGDPERDVLDRVASLVDQNLLRQEVGAEGQPRFMMLETIREFGRERLAESGEEDAVRQQHARFYLELAEARPGWERLEAEHDNSRAALTSSLAEAGDPGMALRLAVELAPFWDHRGYWSEGRNWLKRALAVTPDEATLLRAKALCGAGLFAVHCGRPEEGRRFLEESVAANRALGDRPHLLGALGWLSNAHHDLGDLDAARACRNEGLEARPKSRAAPVENR